MWTLRNPLVVVAVFSVCSQLMCNLPITRVLPDSGGGLDFQRRRAALDDLAEVRDSLNLDDPESAREELHAELVRHSAFEAAGIEEDGSVWGRFNDGRLLIYPADFFNSQGTSIIQEPSTEAIAYYGTSPRLTRNYTKPLAAINSDTITDISIRVTGTLAEAGSNNDLPMSERAVLLSALEGDPLTFGVEEWVIGDMLNKKDYLWLGFPPTVDAFKTGVRDAGVFYINTHGGIGLTQLDSYLYSLETTTPISSENDEKYASDLANGRLTYMGDYENYGITNHFVETYMNFSANSFVFLGSCGGFNSMMQVGFQGAGASVFAGWPKSVYGTCNAKVSEKVFDLLLGTNYVIDMQPPFRSFDYLKVWDYLVSTGNATCGGSSGEPAQLMFSHLGGNFGILAPSIRYMEVREAEKSLTLYGVFGVEEGRVSINDQNVPIRSWEPEKVVVELPPADEAGGYGNVIVTVREHESNPVPLTRWRGQFDYKVVFEYEDHQGNPDEKGTFNLILRGDVHPHRDEPGGELQYREVWFRAAKESEGEFMHGGSASNEDETIAHTGSGSFQWFDPTGDPSSQLPYFSFTGIYDMQSRTLKGNLRALDGRGTIIITTSSGTGEAELPWWILDVLTDDLEFQLDDAYNIQGDRREGTQIQGLTMPSYIIEGLFKWDQIDAEEPPDNNTQSMVGWKGT